MPGGKRGNKFLQAEDYDLEEDVDYYTDDEFDPVACEPTQAEDNGDALLSQLITGFGVAQNVKAVVTLTKRNILMYCSPLLQQQVGKRHSVESFTAQEDSTASRSSALAAAISSPAPLRPSGKPQKNGRPEIAANIAKQAARAAPAHAAAAELNAFHFDQPSPDDRVQRAQAHIGVSSSNGSTKFWLTELTKVPPSSVDQPNRLGNAHRIKQTQSVHDNSHRHPPASQNWQSHLGGAIEIDDDGWQKLPLELEMEMLRQAAAGEDGVPALALTEDSRKRQDVPERSEVNPPADDKPAEARPKSGYVMDADLQRLCNAQEMGTSSKLHLVVLGHVDAGKSTLMGRYLYEIGVVSQKTVHKHQRDAAQMGKASFAWAWLLDERPQERARGVTIDVASAQFETPRHSVTLLDAPGHRDFVPNMIAGAAQADAALLLVDGSKGSFEAGFEAAAGFGSSGGGQTREHAQLARSLGIDQMAVVISKLDTCDYSEARFKEIKAQLLPFLKHCGFREESLQWLPAVGTMNENLTRPPAVLALKSWWKGPTLTDAIDSFKPAERRTQQPLRLPINDVFKGDRGGQSVGGKLEAGAIKVGTRVKVMPSGEEGNIKSIEIAGKPVDLARAGDSADVTLANIDAAVLGAGAVLCHPDFSVPLVERVEAHVVVLEVQIPIVRGQEVTVHAHAARENGHISKLVALIDPKKGKQLRHPRVLTKGQTAVVEITMARPTCLELYSDFRALGRLVLREGGQTLAVGIVTSLLA